MNFPTGKNPSCDEIMTLLNELVDGEMTEERRRKAEAIIEANPQCKAYYKTLLKTVDLFRIYQKELKCEWKFSLPESDGDETP